MWQWGQWVLQPSIAAVAAAVSLAGGLVLWWIRRQRRERLWLPTLRLFPDEFRPLPQLTWEPPRWIPFLLFVALGLCAALAAWQPSSLVATSKDRGEPRVHVLIDLSPSVSAVLDIAELRTRVEQLLGNLLGRARVSVGSSASALVTTIDSPAAAQTWSAALSYHRPGVRLGALVREQMQMLDPVDRLYLLSDQDAFSWGDFDWQALALSTDVQWVAPTRNPATQNIFINGLQCETKSGSLGCRVDVQRRSTEDQRNLTTVNFEVSLTTTDHQVLARAPASLPARAIASEVQLNILADEMARLDPAKVATIEASLTVAADDAMAMDNRFAADFLARRQSALMVAAIAGERMVDDYNYYVQKSLQVQDIELDRMDRIEQPGPNPLEYPFWILVGGQGEGVDQFCPRSLQQTRLRSGQLSGSVLWLLPSGPQTNYSELCWCFARLALADKNAEEREPQMCKAVTSAALYAELLVGLGAKPVGGQLNDPTTSKIWSVEAGSGLNILAFTIALQPETVGFAGMPLLMRQLTQLRTAEKPRGVPRISQLSAKMLLDESLLQASNVPAGESAMVRKPAAEMPPKMLITEKPLNEAAAASGDRDAWPWIRWMLPIAAMLCLLEALYYLRARKRLTNRSAIRRAPQSSSAAMQSGSALLLLAIGVTALAERSYGRFDINLVGYRLDRVSLLQLRDDVEARTSLNLNESAQIYPSFDQRASEQPVIWVDQLSQVSEGSGRLHPRVERWLKRGGFLVIEGSNSLARLKQLTTGYAVLGDEKRAEWRVIPPDHELMRSFYLLQALPSCAGSVWHGLQFDARLAAIAIPFNFTETLLDQGPKASCALAADREQNLRAFVNLLMVVLATDYKRDQIHLPEVLKRLR